MILRAQAASGSARIVGRVFDVLFRGEETVSRT